MPTVCCGAQVAVKCEQFATSQCITLTMKELPLQTGRCLFNGLYAMIT